jgi:hypothetical protein
MRRFPALARWLVQCRRMKDYLDTRQATLHQPTIGD